MKCFEQDIDIENKLKSAIFSISDITDDNKNLQDWQWEKIDFIRELKSANFILQEQLQKLQDGKID